MGRPLGSGIHRGRKIDRTRHGRKFTLEFDWDARLGEIWLSGKIVDCMQVHDYDFSTGTLTQREREREQIAENFEEWLDDNATTYINEWKYL